MEPCQRLPLIQRHELAQLCKVTLIPSLCFSTFSPQGATTERSDYPPIKSWQFAAINRDCDPQSAWQLLRTGLQCLICSKSYKMHPGRRTRPDGCMILGNSNGLSSLAIGRRRGESAPHKGPADLTVALHIIEPFVHLKG